MTRSHLHVEWTMIWHCSTIQVHQSVRLGGGRKIYQGTIWCHLEKPCSGGKTNVQQLWHCQGQTLDNRQMLDWDLRVLQGIIKVLTTVQMPEAKGSKSFTSALLWHFYAKNPDNVLIYVNCLPNFQVKITQLFFLPKEPETGSLLQGDSKWSTGTS